MTPDDLTTHRLRLGYNDYQFAEYLGVPVNSYRNWIRGDRKIPQTVFRLVSVLQLVHTMAPGIHVHFEVGPMTPREYKPPKTIARPVRGTRLPSPPVPQ